MSYATRYRQVPSNRLVVDQEDFFDSDDFNRIADIEVDDITAQLYFNNTLQSWTLTDGTDVQDIQCVSGSIYFYEFLTGLYSLRFRPNAVGFWRLIVTYSDGDRVSMHDYDVTSGTASTNSGITAAFYK